jgi:hypothetical protein
MALLSVARAGSVRNAFLDGRAGTCWPFIQAEHTGLMRMVLGQGFALCLGEKTLTGDGILSSHKHRRRSTI